jgi:hypothetical protein
MSRRKRRDGQKDGTKGIKRDEVNIPVTFCCPKTTAGSIANNTPVFMIMVLMKSVVQASLVQHV